MKAWKAWIIVISLVIADQISKIALNDVNLGIFNYTVNYGAAFSLLQGWRWMFIAIAFAVIFLLIYYYKQFKFKVPVLLVIAGSIGNLVDRLFLGYVRDFIDLGFWPVFNLADSYNTIGIILIVYFMLKEK